MQRRVHTALHAPICLQILAVRLPVSFGVAFLERVSLHGQRGTIHDVVAGCWRHHRVLVVVKIGVQRLRGVDPFGMAAFVWLDVWVPLMIDIELMNPSFFVAIAIACLAGRSIALKRALKLRSFCLSHIDTVSIYPLVLPVFLLFVTSVEEAVAG